MTSSLMFWCFAWVLFTTTLVIAFAGWRAVRRGDRALHRRRMKLAGLLLGVFVGSYVAKVLLLGRENLAAWDPASVVILRVHETFIALMLLAGGRAGWLARAAAASPQPTLPADLAARHRWAGRLALWSGLGALGTASLVLLGMLRRAL